MGRETGKGDRRRSEGEKKGERKDRVRERGRFVIATCIIVCTCMV